MQTFCFFVVRKALHGVEFIDTSTGSVTMKGACEIANEADKKCPWFVDSYQQVAVKLFKIEEEL